MEERSTRRDAGLTIGSSRPLNQTATHRGEEEEGGGKNWEMIGGQEQDLETAFPRLEDVELGMRDLESVMFCRIF